LKDFTEEGPFDAPGLVEVTSLDKVDRTAGMPTVIGGRAQMEYIRRAITAAKQGRVEALCTAPVSKEQITRAGIRFMGHTEVLAVAFEREVLMLMDGPRVRVALATNHLPLRAVPGALSCERLILQLELLSKTLRPMLQRAPRIGVCGLNPHAGEGGELGHEDVQIIAPAIAAAKTRGVKCEGPLAADGLFAQADRMPYDVVLAMYHDQGLIAAKALDFEETVNVTLGLPLPRTSPDHGVAYDIAGKGKANPEPMIQALLKAAALVPK
jgi:4-hydroxythreonine-4-phosphate dehydrogenase